MERCGEEMNDKRPSLRLEELDEIKVSSRDTGIGGEWQKMDGNFEGTIKKLEYMDEELCIMTDDGESERAIPLMGLAGELGRYYGQEPLHIVRLKVFGGAHGRTMDITTPEETITNAGYSRIKDGEDGSGIVLVETDMEELDYEIAGMKTGGKQPTTRAIPLDSITHLIMY